MSTYNYNDYGTPSPGPGPGNTGPNRSNNNRGNDDFVETLSWIIDVGLIFVWFPVGLFLTIANSMGHNFMGSIIRSIRKSFQSSGSSGGAVGTRSANNYYDVGQNRTASSRVGQVPPQYKTTEAQRVKVDTGETGAAAKTAEKEKNDGIRHADRGSVVMEVFGWVIGALGALAVIGAIGSGLWSVLSALAIVLGGGALIWSGRKARKKEAAFKRCFTVSGDKGVVKLNTLARTLGVSEEELEKQVLEMIDRGFYGEKAYIDHARGLLVIDPAEMRDVYKAEDEAKAAGRAAEERNARTEYEKIIAEIRQADEDIEDEVMSEKIRTMQELTAAIFQEVEANPEKKPQIQRFMNYYLPTTLKLLDAYARIEQQGVSGENMAKSKAEIERIADTLVEGYKKQLDTLYQSDVVDITGDVSVIENMMRRDGLTGKSDFTIKVPKNEAAAESSQAEEAHPSELSQEGGQVMGGH